MQSGPVVNNPWLFEKPSEVHKKAPHDILHLNWYHSEGSQGEPNMLSSWEIKNRFFAFLNSCLL